MTQIKSNTSNQPQSIASFNRHNDHVDNQPQPTASFNRHNDHVDNQPQPTASFNRHNDYVDNQPQPTASFNRHNDHVDNQPIDDPPQSKYQRINPVGTTTAMEPMRIYYYDGPQGNRILTTSEVKKMEKELKAKRVKRDDTYEFFNGVTYYIKSVYRPKSKQKRSVVRICVYSIPFIIFWALVIARPMLADQLPQFYCFADKMIEVFEWFYGIINKLIDNFLNNTDRAPIEAFLFNSFEAIKNTIEKVVGLQ